jgi:hypothetical protein
MTQRSAFILAGVVLAAVVAAPGCRKAMPTTPPPAPAPAPAGGAPAPAPGAPAPAPQLGGAPPGKAQTRMREVMDRARAMTQLHNVGQLLATYKTENNRSPGTLQEFLDYIKTEAHQEHESLMTGYFVYKPTPDPTSQTVVVYEKDPDTSGQRLALMGDGSVQRLNEEQFKAAVPAAK